MNGGRLLAALAAPLLLSGCGVLPWGGTTDSPTIVATMTTCEGDAASTRYTLPINASAPQTIGKATLIPTGVSRDEQGLRGSLQFKKGSVSLTLGSLRVGSSVDVGAETLKLTQLCIVENLPSPMPPGTSRGSIGLG